MIPVSVTGSTVTHRGNCVGDASVIIVFGYHTSNFVTNTAT